MMYAIFKLLINYFITFRRTFIIFLSYFVLYSSIYSKCCQGGCCKHNSISQSSYSNNLNKILIKKPKETNQIGNEEEIKKREEEIKKREEEEKKQREEAEKKQRKVRNKKLQEEQKRKEIEEEQKRKKIEEERRQKEEEKIIKQREKEEELKKIKEEEKKQREEAEKKQIEERNKRLKEQEEAKRLEQKRKKIEEERLKREEEERRQKEEEKIIKQREKEEELKKIKEEERKRREEAEKKQREEERLKREKEEKERIERERKLKEEEEIRKQREKEKEEERKRKEKEEDEKRQKEDEEEDRIALISEDGYSVNYKEALKKFCERHKSKYTSEYIKNNFKGFKVIGEGAYAKVYLCEDNKTKEELVVKLIKSEHVRTNEDLKSLFQEIKNLASVTGHLNIVNFKGFCIDGRRYYIIQEYYSGGTLDDYIIRKVGGLTVNEAASFFYQLINGVKFLHSQDIVHRDLKVENLLLTEKNILKICDFGFSKKINKGDMLRRLRGTPYCWAPEMIENKPYDGTKTDIWASGVILYTMLHNNKLPFNGKDIKDICWNILKCKNGYTTKKKIDKDADDLIEKIFKYDPKDRITIDEIIEHKFYLRGKEIFEKMQNNIKI